MKLGLISLGTVGVIVAGAGLMPSNAPKFAPQDDGMVLTTDDNRVGGAGAGNIDDGSRTGDYENPELPPDAPPGSIPEGYTASRTGDAAICFDGTGYYPPGDTHIAATAHTIDGQYLNGDTTKYVVVNRQDYGNIPLGSKVYAYNHTTGQGTWAIVGDRGPTQTRSEMSVATAEALGVNIHRDGNGNYMNANSQDKVTFHFYN